MDELNKIMKYIPHQEDDSKAVFHLIRRLFSISPKCRFYILRKVDNDITNKYNIKFICKLKPIGI